jgi:hypothetical protein
MSNGEGQRPSISRLRRRAKNAVKQHQVYDPVVAALLESNHPLFAKLKPDDVFARPLPLSVAQFALARANGSSSWPQFIKKPAPGENQSADDGLNIDIDQINNPDYQQRFATHKGLPPIGTTRTNCNGVEYSVSAHMFVPSGKSLERIKNGTIAPHIDELGSPPANGDSADSTKLCSWWTDK